MLLSPLFMLLYSAALIIVVPSSLVPRVVRRRVHRAAARLIGGFRKFNHISHYMRDVLHWLHSHRASLTGSRPWCVGTCLAGRPPICASSAALSSHVQAVVHSLPLLTVIWWSHSPALRQCRPFHFLSLVS